MPRPHSQRPGYSPVPPSSSSRQYHSHRAKMNTGSRSPLLLPLLLLFLLLSLVLPAKADLSSCLANISLCEASELMDIGSVQQANDHTQELDLETYVQPDEGFLGVSVVAQTGNSTATEQTGNSTATEQTGNSTATAWFTLNNTCFVNVTPTAWWTMQAIVGVVMKDGDHNIQFQLRTGACSDACWIQTQGTDELLSFDVVAHGPSRWRQEQPHPGMCKVKKELKTPVVASSRCKPPPESSVTLEELKKRKKQSVCTPSQNTATQNSTIGIISVLLGVLLVLEMVVMW